MQPSARARAHALEAVEDLEHARVEEQRQRAELPMTLERSTHRRERYGIAQAQRREPLAQRRDLDVTRLGPSLLHEPHAITAPPDRRGSRVTTLPGCAGILHGVRLLRAEGGA